MQVQSNEACLHILQLPAQVLMQILKHLDQQDRHTSAALTCSAFSTAAAVATDNITVELSKGAASKLTALPEWLQKHAQEASIRSITVRSAARCTLLLPLQHLTALQQLDISSAHVAWTTEAAADKRLRRMAVVLPPDLSALTHLSMQYMVTDVAALPAFTRLQHLVLSAYRWDIRPGNFTSSNVQAFATALPKLLQLTCLKLHMIFTEDTALAGVQQLSSLQHLSITGASCTAASFQALRKSLTYLQYGGFMPEPRVVTFSTDSTPGITQLPNLQELSIRHAVALHPAALGALTTLRKVAATGCPVPTGGLSALTRLELSYLGLGGLTGAADSAAAPVATDFAALTTSNQLTYLDVGLVGKQHCQDIFPAGRCRPNIWELHGSMGLLCNVATVKALVACCPGLRCLILFRQAADEAGVLQPGGHPEECSLAHLQGLTQLTHLCMLAQGEEFSAPVWRALCKLRTLRELYVGGITWEDFGGVVGLTQLQQLTELELQDVDTGLHLNLTNKAPAGSPPDVWRQLPSCALRMAVTHLEECAGQGEEATSRALSLIAQINTDVVLELHHKQQEHEGLQQQLAEMQAQLKAQRQQLDQQQQLQQEVAELRHRQQEQEQEQQLLRQELAELRALLFVDRK